MRCAIRDEKTQAIMKLYSTTLAFPELNEELLKQVKFTNFSYDLEVGVKNSFNLNDYLV